MKRIFILFTMVLGLFLTACHEQPTPVFTTFNITVSDVTASTATVTVEPSDSTTWYYFDIMPVEYLAEYDGDSAIAQEYLDWIQEEVEYYNAYGYPVELTDWLSQGVDSYTFEELTGNTEYMALAFAVDTATETVVGPLFHVNFTTLPVEPTLLTFELANSDTALWFLPNNEEITYFADYVSVDTLTDYGITAAEYFEVEVEYYGELIPYFTQSGAIYLPWSYLNPGESYVFLARAYTGGEWNSDLFTTEFTVPTFEPETVPARDRNSLNRLFGKNKTATTQRNPRLKARK